MGRITMSPTMSLQPTLSTRHHSISRHSISPIPTTDSPPSPSNQLASDAKRLPPQTTSSPCRSSSPTLKSSGPRQSQPRKSVKTPPSPRMRELMRCVNSACWQPSALVVDTCIKISASALSMFIH